MVAKRKRDVSRRRKRGHERERETLGEEERETMEKEWMVMWLVEGVKLESEGREQGGRQP